MPTPTPHPDPTIRQLQNDLRNLTDPNPNAGYIARAEQDVTEARQRLRNAEVAAASAAEKAGSIRRALATLGGPSALEGFDLANAAS